MGETETEQQQETQQYPKLEALEQALNSSGIGFARADQQDETGQWSVLIDVGQLTWEQFNELHRTLNTLDPVPTLDGFRTTINGSH